MAKKIKVTFEIDPDNWEIDRTKMKMKGKKNDGNELEVPGEDMGTSPPDGTRFLAMDQIIVAKSNPTYWIYIGGRWYKFVF